MAVLVPPDWQQLYPSRDSPMDVPATNPTTTNKQRSSPTNDPSHHHHTHSHPAQQQHQPLQQPSQQPQQSQQQQQQQQHHQHQQFPYSFPIQQQPQGSWTPSISAAPFYPSFYQNHQQQQSPQPYPNQIPPQGPFYDAANAQLAQWAYQQMMFNAQHGFPPMPNQHQRNPPNSQVPNDYFAQNQLSSIYNPFPSGTPPPHRDHRGNNPGDQQQQQQQQQQQYPGFHPYRRPTRPQQQQHSQDGSDWRPGPPNVPHPPYARPEASGSTSSVNSSGSHRQRTNSNQSGHSGHNNPSANGSVRSRSGPPSGPTTNRSSPAPPSPSGTTAAGQLRIPHHRNSSSSSSSSTATSARPSAASTAASSTPSSSASTLAAPIPRPARPSPLSQGNFTAAEKRMSRDDSDLLDPAPASSHLRSGGLKGRLRRALSFNPTQSLKEDVADDDESIKASASPNKLKAKTPALISAIDKSGGSTASAGRSSVEGLDDASSTITGQTTKKRGRAASLFNSRLNASTDNISLSSTVSSASVMIRKLGSMGRLARRNSLAGIASLFKDKDKKKKDGKKGGSKGEASEASVSHVTAELDRSSTGDWGADMHGLSPAAKLARQHTLKSNAEAAARAKAQQEAAAAAAAAVTATTTGTSANATASPASPTANGVNGSGVPTWERNTTTRQGSVSPVKGGNMRVNEDGTRVLVEDDEDESDEGHYELQQPGQHYNADGWDDDEDWEGDGDEDTTIRVGLERVSLDDDAYEEEVEPWAIDVRRSIEKTRRPMKGILKYAESYNQSAYLAEQPNPTTRLRSNSYNSHPGPISELGPLARIPSPDPDHIDGLHRHSHVSQGVESAPSLPPLSFDSSTTISLDSTSNGLASHPEKTNTIFSHPNSSMPVLSHSGTTPVTLTHRSATAPYKKLTFANNLSVYDTFSSTVYDRRSEPATWSRLTPALAQRIKEELNSYKMEEMEVHAASRIHTQFFV